MQSINPVLLTEQATRKLPRVFVLLMFIAYAFSGLVGRDPWRGDDALGFGVALSFAQNTPWAQGMMQVAGVPIAIEGPLWFSVVALFIKLFFFIPPHIAAYIPVALIILIGMTAMWYATYYLARTPAAQPLSLALGGQPKPVAYACAVADGATLLLLATLGIAQKWHELSAEAAQLSLQALLMMGVCMALYKPKQAQWYILGALLALGLNRGAPGVIPSLLWVLLISLHPAWGFLKTIRLYLCLVALVSIVLPAGLSYAFSSAQYAQDLLHWNWESFGLASWGKWLYFFSNTMVIAWPVLPFAAAALWRWRRSIRAAHMWVGVSYLVCMVAGVLTQTTITEASFLTLIPGAVVLAAFLLPALPRTWMNAIDWFGVMALSFITLLCWVGWSAMTLGWPEKLARNILRITPTFEPRMHWLALCVALLFTVFWLFVVRWRATHSTTVVWRAAVIWSAGSVTVWVLLGSLWMPWLNYGKSYKQVASELKTVLVDHTQCVTPIRLGIPQRAVLAYFGDLQFESVSNTLPQALTVKDLTSNIESNTPDTAKCDWLLVYDSLQKLSSLERLPHLPKGQWTLTWEGRRYTDKDERFRLYQRRQVNQQMPLVGVGS